VPRPAHDVMICPSPSLETAARDGAKVILDKKHVQKMEGGDHMRPFLPNIRVIVVARS